VPEVQEESILAIRREKPVQNFQELFIVSGTYAVGGKEWVIGGGLLWSFVIGNGVRNRWSVRLSVQNVVR